MSDFLEAAEGKAIDALYDARDQGRMMGDAGKEAMRATIESLRDGAVARVQRAVEDWKRHQSIVEFAGGPAMSRDDFARLCVAAVLGPEPETEPDPPDESDIAEMRYDEQRATEKDER